jgi:hypothetical protein
LVKTTGFLSFMLGKKDYLIGLFLVFGLYSFSQLPQLKVSDNKHFLITQDGKPFFWLADTGWELFHRLNRHEAEEYFKRRSEQGFNVIQAVALAELNGLHTANTNGDIPLQNDDPARPNENYFKFIDSLIDLAAQYHLYIALFPTWGDKLFKNSWGVGPEIFNAQNAFIYGKWIGQRYKSRTNIIWVIGGDRSPREHSLDESVWRAMAQGIKEGLAGAAQALMTFHPQPDGTSSSSQWFQQDEWLSLNMLQTGHCRDSPVWDLIEADYNKTPTKPVLNGENIYEEMPVCFNPKELGYASAYDVRKSAYLSVFAGACGHTYGCGPVIWFSARKEHIFAAFHDWKEALTLTGAEEMKYLRNLIESRPELERIPDQGLLINEGPCASERIQATRGKDYAFIYSAYGDPIRIRNGRIGGKTIVASWYNPRTGQNRLIGSFDNVGEQVFTPPLPVHPPVPSEREDWVLILDNAQKALP